MDVILGTFADQRLARLSEEELKSYDALLSENDHDLYQWVTGQMPPPEHFAGLMAQISKTAGANAG